MKSLKILIVDDHQVTREGIKQILSIQKEFTATVTEAKNGNEAMALARQYKYDVIIMDIQMPEKDGIETTEELIKRDKNTRILALSMFNDKQYIISILKAGAMGYILKNTGAEEIITAIETVAGGKKYFCNEVAQTIMEPYFDNILFNNTPKRQNYTATLSKREKEVLRAMLCASETDKISVKLNISKRTVENHKYRMMEKLNVKSTAELVRLAIENKIV